MSTPATSNPNLTPAQKAQASLNQAATAVASHPVVQQGTEVAQRQLNILDKELAKFGFFRDAEAKTGVPKTYGFLGTLFVFSSLIVFNIFGWASPVTNLIGWALPAYLSCAALESPGAGDDKQWLTYWVVFGFFNFLESSMLRLVLYYFPMYFTFKLFFTVWLMLPATRGAEKVYHVALKPLFKQASPKVSKLSSKSSTTTNTTHSLHSPSASTSGFSTGVDVNVGSKNPFAGAGTTTDVGVGSGAAAGVPLP